MHIPVSGINAPVATSQDQMAESAVLKAVAILKCLADRAAPTGVQQIASETALNVSTVHRLLQMMVVDGMVSYDPQARTYAVGTECVRLATRVLGSDGFLGRIRPEIADLARRLGETCAYTMYEPHRSSKIVAVVERGPHPLGYDFQIGTRDGVHSGASGKAILAFLPDAEIGRILRKPLARLTPSTIIDREELSKQIRQIRKRGFATSRGERLPGGFGVAAPVFDPRGQVIGSIVVTVPSFRWRKERLADVARTVTGSARRVSALSDGNSIGFDE